MNGAEHSDERSKMALARAAGRAAAAPAGRWKHGVHLPWHRAATPLFLIPP